jgi:signal transduction histidine kinase
MLAIDPFREIELTWILEAATAKLRHDLRNKLSGIQNMAFYLAKQVKSTDLAVKNPLVGEFFQSLEDNVQHADVLLEQTSSFTEPTLARGAFREASIVDCIQQAIDHCRAGDVSVTFDLKADPHSVVIETASIVVALRALLENAIEAIVPGRAARQVTISGRVRRDRYVIEVVDPGPGMGTPAEALTPFFSTKPGHLGLGLNVAHHVAVWHHGELSISDGAPGATATLSVPCASSEGTE